jgi:hypothetical protein
MPTNHPHADSVTPARLTSTYARLPESPDDPRPIRVPGRSRLAVVGVTVAAALAVWAILAPVAGITLQAQQGGRMHINACSVFFASAAEGC